MRYVVSDIHGDFDLLVKYLKKVNFNSNDILYVLGDVLDKGKDIVKLIDLLFHKLKNNCVVIAGNHEYDFSKYVKILISDNLDDETILKKVQDYLQIEEPISFEDIETILNLPFYVEEEEFIMVHSGVSFDIKGRLKALSETPIEELVYNRRFKNTDFLIDIGKCVFFGHTPTSYVCGKPKILIYKKDKTIGKSLKDYYKIHLDTGNYLSGVLGGFCIDTLSVDYVCL